VKIFLNLSEVLTNLGNLFFQTDFFVDNEIEVGLRE
jgi:hypothetical protein